MKEVCKGAARELGLHWPEYDDDPRWLDRHTPAARARSTGGRSTGGRSTGGAAEATVCRTCGQPDPQGVYYTNDCTGCYHLRLVKTRRVSDPAWNLKQARKVAECWTDEAARSERLDEIAALESEIAALLAAPPEQGVIAAPDEDPMVRSLLQSHAESVLAGLLQKINRVELRLLHALVVGLEDMYPEDDESASEDIWNFGTQHLSECATPDLQWIEAAK